MTSTQFAGGNATKGAQLDNYIKLTNKTMGIEPVPENAEYVVHDGDSPYRIHKDSTGKIHSQGYRILGMDTPEVAKSTLVATSSDKMKQLAEGRVQKLLALRAKTTDATKIKDFDNAIKAASDTAANGLGYSDKDAANVSGGKIATMEGYLTSVNDTGPNILTNTGASVTSFNDSQSAATNVSLDKEGSYSTNDKFGRPLIKNDEYAKYMISKGYAVPYTEFKSDLLNVGKEARDNKVGLWANPNAADEMESKFKLRGANIEDSNYLTNLAHGAAGSVGKTLFSAADVVADAGMFLGKKVAMATGMSDAEVTNTFKHSLDKAPELRKYFTEDGDFKYFDKYKDMTTYGYNDRRVSNYSQAFKNVWNSNDTSVLDKIAVTAKGIMQSPEVLATSIGDIIGGASKYVGTGVIIANEMNNILDERKEAADGKPLGFKDYAIATAASVVYGVVNRFTGGNAGLYETKKEVAELAKALDKGTWEVVKNRLHHIGKSGAIEGIEEIIQGAAENVGKEYGTKNESKLFNANERLDLAVQGVLGHHAGAAMAMAGTPYDILDSKRDTSFIDDVASEFSTKINDNYKAGLVKTGDELIAHNEEGSKLKKEYADYIFNRVDPELSSGRNSIMNMVKTVGAENIPEEHKGTVIDAAIRGAADSTLKAYKSLQDKPSTAEDIKAGINNVAAVHGNNVKAVQDTTDMVSKMYGVATTEGKEVIAGQVAKKLGEWIHGKDSSTNGNQRASEGESNHIIQTLMSAFKGNKFVEKEVTDMFSDKLREKFINLKEKHGINIDTDKIPDNELAGLAKLIATMQSFGSEPLDKLGNAMETVLGNNEIGGNGGKPPKKKTIEDVELEAQYGYALGKTWYKGIKDHAIDMEAMSKSDNIPSMKDSNASALNKFINFAESRGINLLNAVDKVKDEKGNVISRTLRSTSSIKRLAEKRLDETVELKNIASTSLTSTNLTDETRTKLTKALESLDASINDYKHLLSLTGADLITAVAGAGEKVFVDNEIKRAYTNENSMAAVNRFGIGSRVVYSYGDKEATGTLVGPSVSVIGNVDVEVTKADGTSFVKSINPSDIVRKSTSNSNDNFYEDQVDESYEDYELDANGDIITKQSTIAAPVQAGINDADYSDIKNGEYTYDDEGYSYQNNVDNTGTEEVPTVDDNTPPDSFYNDVAVEEGTDTNIDLSSFGTDVSEVLVDNNAGTISDNIEDATSKLLILEENLSAVEYNLNDLQKDLSAAITINKKIAASVRNNNKALSELKSKKVAITNKIKEARNDIKKSEATLVKAFGKFDELEALLNSSTGAKQIVRELFKGALGAIRRSYTAYKGVITRTRNTINRIRSYIYNYDEVLRDIRQQERALHAANATLRENKVRTSNRTAIQIRNFKDEVKELKKAIYAEKFPNRIAISNTIPGIVDSDISSRPEQIASKMSKILNQLAVDKTNKVNENVSLKNAVNNLMPLMPNVIKDSGKAGVVKVRRAIKQFKKFTDNRADINITNQKGTEIANGLATMVGGSSFNDLLTNSETRDIVKSALNMATILTLKSMQEIRYKSDNDIREYVEGAFVNTIGEFPDTYEVDKIVSDIREGKYVPTSTYVLDAGRELLNQLEITFGDVTGQYVLDTQLALGELVIYNALTATRSANNNGIVREVLVRDSSTGAITNESADGARNSRVTKILSFGVGTITNYEVSDGAISNMGGVFEFAAEDKEATIDTSPIKDRKDDSTTRNSMVGIAKKAVDYLNAQGKMVWKFSSDFKKQYEDVLKIATKKAATSLADKNFDSKEDREDALLEAIDNAVKYEFKQILLGDRTTMLSSVHPLEFEKTKAAYTADALDIDRMLDTYSLVKDKDFFLKWDYTVSNRSMIDNSWINPQNSKLSRFIVSLDDMNYTINPSNMTEGDLLHMQLAIAQALELGPDKKLDEKVIKDLEKYVKFTIDENGKVATELGDYLKALMVDKVTGEVKPVSLYDLRNAVDNQSDSHIEGTAKNIMHIHQALEAVYAMTVGEEFTTNLALEADGITNGMASTLLQMGLSRTSSYLYEKAGMYVGENATSDMSHGKFKDSGKQDIYETPKEAFIDALSASNEATDMSVLVESIIGGKWRTFLKPLVMVFIYGSSVRNIKQVAGYNLAKEAIMTGKIDKLKELLGSVNSTNDSHKEVINKAFVLLNERNLVAYEYDQKTDKLKLVPASKGSTKYFLSEGQLEIVGSAVTIAIGNQLEEAFDDSFNDINKFRIAHKVVEELNFVAFKKILEDKLVAFNNSSKLGGVTDDKLTDILKEMIDEGSYYAATNSLGGLQDYYKTQNENTEDTIQVVIGGNQFQSNKSRANISNINRIIREVISNVGAIGVTDKHSLDGSTMVDAHTTKTLNIFDALVLGVNSELNNKQINQMNKSFYELNMNHSSLGEAVGRLLNTIGRNPDVFSTIDADSYLAEMVSNNFNRIIGNDKTIVKPSDVLQILRNTHDDRRQLARTPIVMKQYYISDDMTGYNSNTDENWTGTLPEGRFGVFATDNVENEVSIIEKALEKLDRAVEVGTAKKADTKDNYDIITELNTYIEDSDLSDNIKKFVLKNFKQIRTNVVNSFKDC